MSKTPPQRIQTPYNLSNLFFGNHLILKSTIIAPPLIINYQLSIINCQMSIVKCQLNWLFYLPIKTILAVFYADANGGQFVANLVRRCPILVRLGCHAHFEQHID